MNKDQVEGKWEQLKGKAKEKWGKLTDDDWKVAEGKRDQIAGKIQEHYGYTKEQAQTEWDKFAKKHTEQTESAKADLDAAAANVKAAAAHVKDAAKR